MNIEKHLILIKDEDKTDKIQSCKYENKMYTVLFTSGKSYRYNYNNVTWLREPQELNIKDKLVYANNKPLIGAIKALQFSNYVKVIYKNNFHDTYNKNEITIEDSTLSNEATANCFYYLKELSKNIGLIVDGQKSSLQI